MSTTTLIAAPSTPVRGSSSSQEAARGSLGEREVALLTPDRRVEMTPTQLRDPARRKEALAELSPLKSRGSVYSIKAISPGGTGRRYIGMTDRSACERFNEHVNDATKLRRPRKLHRELSRATSVSLGIVYRQTPRKSNPLSKLEQLAIKYFGTEKENSNSLNMVQGGGGGSAKSSLRLQSKPTETYQLGEKTYSYDHSSGLFTWDADARKKMSRIYAVVIGGKEIQIGRTVDLSKRIVKHKSLAKRASSAFERALARALRNRESIEVHVLEEHSRTPDEAEKRLTELFRRNAHFISLNHKSGGGSF